MRECEEKFKFVHLARDSWLDLATCKLPKDAYEWSMQRSWTVTPAGALQDKKSNLTIQLTRGLDSQLSQVARPSCQSTLFGKNWLFAFHTIRLNLINHFVGFIPCQFACNSALRNPIFRWESCKGSVLESVKKCSRLCTEVGTRYWIS